MTEQQMRLVELKKIRPNKLNPRLGINIERLNELAESIKQIGVLEPLILRPAGDGFEVVVGERRYRAAQQAGLETVPAIIHEYTDEQVIELNLIENIQREELTAVEKGNCIKQLLTKYQQKYPSRQVISTRIGISPETISTWLKLTEAPEELQKLVAPQEKAGTLREMGKIDYSTAATIVRQIETPERQVEVAKEIAAKPLPSKKAREIVKKIAKEPEKTVEEAIKEVVEAPPKLAFDFSQVEPILTGAKTQNTTRTAPPQVKQGATVVATIEKPDFAELRVTMVERKRLKYFTEDDARAEGYPSLEKFKKQWRQKYGEWDENELVYIVHFEKLKP
ncbi:MAG: ParB/RepB/Spo0J family partition protein [Candidatus Bathyarchaeales archaeon]